MSVTEHVIAVDLGGTNIRAAVVTRTGQIRHLLSQPTLADDGPDAVIDRIADAIAAVVSAEDVAPEVAVGVVAPGPLDPVSGVVFFGPNLPGWHDVPLKEILTRRTGRRVLVGNDANCAALGEAHFGAAQGIRNLIYIALGTGVGGGVIAEGRLIEGARGLGGELGHVPVAIDGPRCTCGGIGCIEAFAGGWAIAREGELVAHSDRSTEIARLAEGKPVTARMVAQAARHGDAAARAVYERAGQALGVGLGGLVNVFNPEMIVIGGGLAEAGDLILDPMRAELPRRAMRQIYPGLRIERSSLGTNTGLYGAAARVFYQQEIAEAP